MITFKECVIFYRNVDGTYSVYEDDDYSPSPKRSRIADQAIEECAWEWDKIVERMSAHDLYAIMVNKDTDVSLLDLSPAVAEIVEAAVKIADVGSGMFDDGDGSEDGWISDMKTEMRMVEKDRERAARNKKIRYKRFGGNEIAYITSMWAFYDPRFRNKVYKASELARAYKMETKELNRIWMRENVIARYDAIEYVKSTDSNFEMVDRLRILSPRMLKNKRYERPESVKFLISNLCAWDLESIDHVNMLVLRKVLNPETRLMPALVFFGNGWSGKGLFVKLLSTIFGKRNVRANISRDTLSSRFWFSGDALVAEFAEIATHNTSNDKRMANKMKNMIGAEEIEVNKKGIRRYFIKNVTWFIISSNDMKPIRLDVGTGNRRYSVIRVGRRIPDEKGYRIYEEISKEKVALRYVNRLMREYGHRLPSVIRSLDNSHKKNLLERTKTDIRQFWDVFSRSEKYEEWRMIRVVDVRQEFIRYCSDNGVDHDRTIRFLWSESPYERTSFRVGPECFKGIKFTKNP